jgi:hypothetical protein
MSRHDEIIRPRPLGPLLPIVAIMRLGASLGVGEWVLRRLLLKPVASPRPRVFRNYVPSERDVFVTTFLKSGTNWAMQMCVEIAHRGAAEFEHIHELVPWPEAPLPALPRLDEAGPWCEAPTGLRVIKTHLARRDVPISPAARYVTLIRDPKEVVVSAHHFMLGMVGIREHVSVSRWVELFFEPGLLGTAWAEHTAGFWAVRERPNVLVRTFNQAKANLPGMVTELATHLGVELSEDEHARVVERSSFAWMRANEAKFQPPTFPLVNHAAKPKMVRRGAVGGSHELLDADQRARIDDFAREQLRRIGSEFPYDELFGS